MKSKLIILGCGSSVGTPRIDGYWGNCNKMIGVRSQHYKELPFSIVGSVAFLSCIGLIVLNSISRHQQGDFLNSPFNKQILLMIPAISVLLMIIFLPRYSIHKYSYPMYLIGIVIIIMPFFGQSHANTFRWLDIGLPFKIQPSEFAKVFTTIALARYLSDHTIQMKKFNAIIIPIGFTLNIRCITTIPNSLLWLG